MLFRFRSSEAGAHTHVRFFAGKGEGYLGYAGNFVLRNEEWAAFKMTFSLFAISNGSVQFIADDDTSKIDR